MSWPDFFLIGTPKGGTTALHSALVGHPQLYLSSVKEPKFFLCDGRRPARSNQVGPGDAHSAREWVWRESDYLRLFADAPAGTLTGESTPFYLYDQDAQRRIATTTPDARLIAVIRDPVDRAYSNWTHLWSDGLEPVADFNEALAKEDSRVAAGYAPFWHYARVGHYGAQLKNLYELFPREQVLVLRYRELAEEPDRTIAAVCDFLGVKQHPAAKSKPDNVHPYVSPGIRQRLLSSTIRAGAAVGSYAPPQIWRSVEGPLRSALHAGGGRRPQLTVEQRRDALTRFADDIGLLEDVLGRSFDDWRSDAGRGEFSQRWRG
ncbi:sulfotransferase family protein [Jatrophihabitans sp. GAS493]|uniref:sulfotransferase family protein n=1 Tax=Jatrophihabitans sp. GAS493 TaxID=1907575 RepID=UPI000BB6ABB1|nr:sulfotransferase [Jatrophihabitans sp. GAS493]SOD74853.1 sulfotransferase family protein [Jatrophihabitans sp. GAS493]